MSILQCGDAIQLSGGQRGTAGCLVQFADQLDRLLLLVAGHVVIGRGSAQGNNVVSADDPTKVIGSLLTWTQLDGATTADAALVWLIPGAVDLGIAGLVAPTGVNSSPSSNAQVSLQPLAGASGARKMTISSLSTTVDVRVTGPNWQEMITYAGQYSCKPDLSADGDSGAMLVDDSGRVVGMLVAGSDSAGAIVTPIGALLSPSVWGGGVLNVLTALPDPDTLTAPPGLGDQDAGGQAQEDAATADAAAAQLSFSFDWLNGAQAAMGQRIATAFSDAGFGFPQQIAALANAWAESKFDPLARYQATNEDSVGLFQLNMKGGAGEGYSVSELQDPEVQFRIVIRALGAHADFGGAADADTAVALFVRYFERPHDPDGQIALRRQLAKKFQA